MADEKKSGNGGGTKSFLTHLGINGALVAAVATWMFQTVDKHQQELTAVQKDLSALRVKVKTDAAQWNVIRELNEDVEEAAVTAKANRQILDRMLQASIEKKQVPVKAASKPPRIELRRRPPTTKDYRKQHEDRWMEQQQQSK